jgi:adenine specific DNA methylase Mod
LNTLYYGDNLDILRAQIKDESVALVYLDPQFNSKANYNVQFKAPTGEQSAAQIEAFLDTWHWNESAGKAFDEVMGSGNTEVAELLRSLQSILKENDMMAYLAMMAVRLLQLYRVLKPSGSLYLHCDTTASHYLKILLDGVFGTANFHSEITWKRSHAHSDSKQGRKGYGNISDVLLYYSKSETYVFNTIFMPYEQAYIDKYYRYRDPDGRRFWLDNLTGPGGAGKGNPYYEVMGVSRFWRYSEEKMAQLIAKGRIIQNKPGNVPQYKRYLDEMPGLPLQNIWTDIDPVNMMAKERLGYPKQKPLPLLERILTVSSNEGDVVLDPFCGCGTAVHAAQKLRRNWVGIDITHLAISLIERRLKDAFPGIVFDVHGTPKDTGGARALALQDKYQFQWWPASLVDAIPYGGKKKCADSGIDGFIYFKPDGKTTEKAIVSVKGGDNVGVPMIRDLAHVVEREKAKIGVFITLARPTKPMSTEAIKSGYYETLYGKYPRIQILTVDELFAAKKPNIPLVDPSAFNRPDVEITSTQEKLF